MLHGRIPDATRSTLSLDLLEPRCLAQVRGIDASAAGLPPVRAQQLAELGFVVGEPVAVLRRGWPGGDPLVVRVGSSRFALRRQEAACVQVERLP